MGTEIYRDVEASDLPASQRPRRAQRTTTDSAVRSAPEHYSESQNKDKDPVTQALGWFSVALGAAEIFAPGAVARLIGVNEDEHRGLFRVYGVREIIAGVGILTRPKPTYWMWNRVLGDTIDIATLLRAMRTPGNNRLRLAGATAAVLGVTALDIACSVQLTSEKR